MYNIMCMLLSFICVDFGFTVQVQLSPQQAIRQCANVSIVSFIVFIASKGQPRPGWYHARIPLPPSFHYACGHTVEWKTLPIRRIGIQIKFCQYHLKAISQNKLPVYYGTYIS
jgi:hypothetical protein